MCPNWEEYFLPSIKLLCYDLVKFIDQCLQLLGDIFRFSCVMMSPGDTILTFAFYAIYFFFLPYCTLLKLQPNGEWWWTEVKLTSLSSVFKESRAFFTIWLAPTEILIEALCLDKVFAIFSSWQTFIMKWNWVLQEQHLHLSNAYVCLLYFSYKLDWLVVG